MQIRLITVDAEPARLDGLLEFVRTRVQSSVDALPGNLGMCMYVDRDRGRAVTISAWSSAEARAVSESALAAARAEATRIVGAEPRVRQYDVAVYEPAAPVRPGCWARLVEAAIEPERLGQLAEAFQARALPQLRQLDGLCDSLLLADPATGSALVLTTWTDRAAIDASREATARLRARITGDVGARIVEIVEAEVVLAGLRPQRHETLLRRAYAAMSAGGDLDELDALIAEDLVDHSEKPPGTPEGLAGVKALLAAYREAYPDLQLEVERYLEQGDMACAVLRCTGTHRGPLMGIAPTGRRVDVRPIDVVRVADGRVVEHWGASQDLLELAQLGIALPSAVPQVPAQQPPADRPAPAVDA